MDAYREVKAYERWPRMNVWLYSVKLALSIQIK